MQERDQKDRLFLSGILCAVLALAVVWIGAVSPASAWVSAAFGQCNLVSLAAGSAAARSRRNFRAGWRGDALPSCPYS